MKDNFADYENKLFRLYNEKKYSEALNIAIEASKHFPERKTKTIFWIACLDSRLGKTDDAIKTLESGLQQAVWWPEDMLLRDPDLEPIRERPEFQFILKECRHYKSMMAKTSKPELLIETPKNKIDGPFPVVIVLHERYGQAPETTIRHWSSLLQHGIGLAVPWSSQTYAQDGRCWDDLSIAEKDAGWIISELKKRTDLDLDRIVFAGFSQGAALAIYLTLKRKYDSKGFIAVASSDWVEPDPKRAVDRDQPNPKFTSFVRASDAKGLRGIIIIGDKDLFYNKMEFLKNEMVKRGLDCNYQIKHGIGHEYPSDFASEVRQAIDFVLNKG